MSWVIVDRQTEQAVLETFSKKIADNINLDRYMVIPIKFYLYGLNEKINGREYKHLWQQLENRQAMINTVYAPINTKTIEAFQ